MKKLLLILLVCLILPSMQLWSASRTKTFAKGDTWETIIPTSDKKGEKRQLELTDPERSIISAQNDFGFSLFRLLSKADKNENTLFSPLSLSLNLGMLINGASGKPAEDLRRMTGIGTDTPVEELNDLNRRLILGLTEVDTLSTLLLANSIWFDKKLQIEREFIEVNRDNYFVSVFKRPLYTKATQKEINNWVSRNTRGVIDHILDEPLEKPQRMTLINALYFCGAWIKPFARDDTKKGIFNCIDGKKSEVDMMYARFSKAHYSKCGDYLAVDLSLGDGAYKFTFILPDQGVSLEDAEKGINMELLDSLSHAKKTYCHFYLPRFEVNSHHNLSKTLLRMGYGSIFSSRDSYKLIAPREPLFLGRIMQKSRIKIDEEGAEGAAVTYLEWVTSPGITSTPPKIVLDRPFIFIVSEVSTGAILFVGDVKSI